MRLLDATIEALSPQWAARRTLARASLRAFRSYDAAKTSRRTEGWMTSGTAANAEIGSAAASIRNRTRDLVRNNPWAAQAVRKLATKTVGVGIVPRLQADASDPRRKAFAEAWDAFAETCDPEGQLDLYGLQYLVARTMFESGEALVRLIPRPSSWRLGIPLQIQVLEPDYLDSARTLALPTGGVIIQGVEYDRDGRRVAYWLFGEHPGAWPRRASAQSSLRVPADQVLHIFDPLRPGQARGVSTFTPAVLRLKDLDDYADAEMMRKKVAACFAAFVKRSGGPAAGPLAGGRAGSDESGRRIEGVSPGAIQYLALGEDVTFSSPPAAEGYLDFMTHELHAVAAGIGTTYEQLTGDLSRVNYSSIRAGMIDFYDLVDRWQWHVFVPQLCRPIWARFTALMVATGQASAAEPLRSRWSPPRRRWVDPEKEVRAAKDAVRSGFSTLYDVIAEQGEDPDERLDEMAKIQERLDSLGLRLESDPRVSLKAGAPPAQDAAPAG